MRLILSRRRKRFDNISKEVCDALGTEKGSHERNVAFRKFHREIAMDYNVAHLCGENKLMPEDLERIVEDMVALGFGWHHDYYVPVAAFTYADTFGFLMNRRYKLNESDYEEIMEYLYKFF